MKWIKVEFLKDWEGGRGYKRGENTEILEGIGLLEDLIKEGIVKKRGERNDGD